MFKRMILEDWAIWAPIISFVLIAGVFIVMTIRALRINKTEREHLEKLPLDESDKPPTSKPSGKP